MSHPRLPELLVLPAAERVQLAQGLWDSVALEPGALPFTEADRAEAERRLADHRRDPRSAIPWTEVRARLREHLG